MSRATRDYRCRAERARHRMSDDQRAAFDAIVVEELTLPAAAERLGLSEAEVLKLFASAFRIHAAEIEAPARRWWCWW